jgi:hypothetical protein
MQTLHPLFPDNEEKIFLLGDFMNILQAASTTASRASDVSAFPVFAVVVIGFIFFISYLAGKNTNDKSQDRDYSPPHANEQSLQDDEAQRNAQIQRRIREIQQGLGSKTNNAPTRQEAINLRRQEIEQSFSIQPKYQRNNYTGNYKERHHISPPTKRQINNFNLNQRIYGIPGIGLDSNTNDFSESNISKGIEGEQKTADIVAKFIADTSETYVFHSLIWPMSYTDADVDHAIVCGDNILFIDSKNWKAKGVYAFNWEGDITLNDQPYRWGKQPKIIPAREKYEDYLCELFGTYRSTVVSSVIAIHSPGSTIGPSSYGRFNHLTTGESLYNFLMAWRLEVGIAENNRKLLASMLTCLK